MSQESGQFYLIADYLLDLFGFPQTADTDSVDQLSVDSHTSSTNPSKNFFEILDTGGGSSIKLVSSYLCSLLAALNEIILVSMEALFRFEFDLERRARGGDCR